MTGNAGCSSQTDCKAADWLDRLAKCPNPQILRVSVCVVWLVYDWQCWLLLSDRLLSRRLVGSACHMSKPTNIEGKCLCSVVGV